MYMRFTGSVTMVVFGFYIAAASAQTITLETLLDEMIDRDRLAMLPSPAYTCAQASSYDRVSVSPDEVSTWFGNRDHNYFVRVEQRQGRREYVMMDEQGPGAIVRIWVTWASREVPFDGTLRIYLDDSEEPAIEGSIRSIIDRGGLVDAPLGESVSPLTPYDQRGHNLHLPIPYATRCTVTIDHPTDLSAGPPASAAFYYQINFRTYENGTGVQSFAMDQLQRYRQAIDRVQQTLRDAPLGDPGQGDVLSLDGELAPGQQRRVRVSGPAAVRQLTMQLAAGNLPQALRSTVLQIGFDDERTVWVPVGDFFGIGYVVAPYQSRYSSVTEDGRMTATWVMPFESSCTITLHNLSDQPVRITGSATVGPWQWDERSMHFHATWHQLTDLTTGNNPGAEHGAFDTNYVTIHGQGVYVGDTLTLYNPTLNGLWWGEGDEKIYVDGETFPSHFGTGTEDYYGYAWCRPEPFTTPFYAQPTGDGNLDRGFSVNSRYRLLDGIPFDRSLKFDMEVWHWERNIKMNYAPTTFFYARPGATTNIAPDPATAALPVRLPEPLPGVEGAIEGERMPVKEVTGGHARLQGSADWGWSGYQQRWWVGGRIGDRLTLLVDVPESGRYHITAALTKARNYGIVKLTLAGRDAGTFDRYHPTVATDVVDLGRHRLEAGQQPLVVEIVGSNEAADHHYMFGLDYVKLTPLE